MSAPAMSLETLLPRTIGRYTLFDRIGRGGMADIFLARVRTELGGSRLVVVKQILPHLAMSSEFSELLITEAKLAARLDHANVVQVHDLGRDDGTLYIAMQYVEGLDVNELLRRCSRTRTPLPMEYALFIVTEALKGLDYAHRRTSDAGKPLGIVHRDVSPSNILISVDGEVKLCDFGIARANDVVDVLPDDVVKGKAGYMSPEQAHGTQLDGRADVFAIGIVLWELMSGRRLYRTGPDVTTSLLDQARRAEIPPFDPRGLPREEELSAIMTRALAPHREDRYPSAQAMLRELEGYVAGARLIASPIRFGQWLMDHFGEDLVSQRRARERAAKAIEAGPLATIEPIGGMGRNGIVASGDSVVRVTPGSSTADSAPLCDPEVETPLVPPLAPRSLPPSPEFPPVPQLVVRRTPSLAFVAIALVVLFAVVALVAIRK